MPALALSIAGQSHGYLTAKRRVRRSPGGWIWSFQCTCGKTTTGTAARFKLGRLKSCGCMRAAAVGDAHRTHGMSKHPAWTVWRNMRNRCTSPRAQQWRNYGARGIKVCKRWASFEKFWTDMGPTYRRGLTLERLNNNGNYTPKNCCWATWKQQASNRRQKKRV